MTQEQAELAARILRQLQRRGAADEGNLSVKILGNYPVEGRHTFQITRSGARRIAQTTYATLEEAVTAAVHAVVHGLPAEAAPVEPPPTAHGRYEAVPIVVDDSDRRKWDVERLVSEYKAQGIPRSSAWSRFVIDRSLSPGIDAKDFYAVWDGVAGKTRAAKRGRYT